MVSKPFNSHSQWNIGGINDGSKSKGEVSQRGNADALVRCCSEKEAGLGADHSTET